MNFLKNRNIFLAISGVFFVLSLLLLIFGKLNLGIDMTGGTQTEYSYENTINIDKIKTELNKEKELYIDEGNKVINNIAVYGVTGEKKVSIVVGYYPMEDNKKLDNLKINFKSKVSKILTNENDTIHESSYINIGKSFGDYIKNTAFITLILAIIAITIYVSFAFSGVVGGISVLSFAVITIITLFHDIIISTGLYMFAGIYFPEFKIDTFFVTALLTILGYSINDTIVVFDRIRSNLRQFAGKKGTQGKNLEEIIDLSIKETLTRSIYTSLTLFFVLITIFIFGPETISGFILVMIFGTIVGTYSSIFIASPILYIVNKDKKLSVYKKVVINPEDKIVV